MIKNKSYEEDIIHVSKIKIPWNKLSDKSVLITGASGLIGSFLIDVLMQKNKESNLDCKVFAMGRSIEHSKNRFSKYWDDNLFEFIQHDINIPITNIGSGQIDYIIHLASNTHPLAYANDPIGTITTNIIGTNNLLKYGSTHNIERFVFASSNEIYGENRGDIELFDENYSGYLNSNTLRAGYPESKRCGEALCQAYYKSKGLDFVIPRFTRTYGPTMLLSDSKVISQFIKNGINGENIVLKSKGNQQYSFTYVADAVSGLLTILLLGKTASAYNISDLSSNIDLKSLANLVASLTNTIVVTREPDKTEKIGFSKATKAMLNGEKLRTLGWKADYTLEKGLRKTITILKSNN